MRKEIAERIRRFARQIEEESKKKLHYGLTDKKERRKDEERNYMSPE